MKEGQSAKRRNGISLDTELFCATIHEGISQKPMA